MNIQRYRFTYIFSGALTSLLLMQVPIDAQVPSQPSQFEQLPILVEPSSQALLTSARQSYAISIQMPVDAGAALASVQIQQPDSAARLNFDLSQTKAFQGTANRNSPIPIQSVEQVKPDQIQINFAQPIQPGTAVTLLLKPQHLPTGRNQYPVVVSALPVGAAASSLELGQRQIETCRSRYDGASDGRVLFWDLPPEFNPYLRDRPCQR